MTGIRYIPVSPECEGSIDDLGRAVYLLLFLVGRQTDPDGRVFYGHAVTYQWIRANWRGNPDKRPTVRTLKKYMGILRRAGLLELRRAGRSEGMRLRLIGSVKWPAELPPAAVQLSLFTRAPVSIRRRTEEKSVEKPVEDLSETGGNPEDTKIKRCTDVPFSPPMKCTNVHLKAVKKQAKEKLFSALAREKSIPCVEKSGKQLQDRRRLLLDQAEEIQRRYKASG